MCHKNRKIESFLLFWINCNRSRKEVTPSPCHTPMGALMLRGTPTPRSVFPCLLPAFPVESTPETIARDHVRQVGHTLRTGDPPWGYLLVSQLKNDRSPTQVHGGVPPPLRQQGLRRSIQKFCWMYIRISVVHPIIGWTSGSRFLRFNLNEL